MYCHVRLRVPLAVALAASSPHGVNRARLSLVSVGRHV